MIDGEDILLGFEGGWSHHSDDPRSHSMYWRTKQETGAIFDETLQFKDLKGGTNQP